MSRTLFRWHRRIGITSAFFVLVLAITGLLLLLGPKLGFDQKTVGGRLVAKAYHQMPKTELVGYDVGGGIWVVMVDGLVYVGAADPVALTPPLIGARAGQNGLITFSNGAEIVTTLPGGDLVERYADSGFPARASTKLSTAVREKTLARYRGRGVPASRLLLDIHTGRVFGPLGPWVMGLASVLLILLSLTGMVMWSTAGPRRKRRQRLQKQAATKIRSE